MLTNLVKIDVVTHKEDNTLLIDHKRRHYSLPNRSKEPKTTKPALDSIFRNNLAKKQAQASEINIENNGALNSEIRSENSNNDSQLSEKDVSRDNTEIKEEGEVAQNEPIERRLFETKDRTRAITTHQAVTIGIRSNNSNQNVGSKLSKEIENLPINPAALSKIRESARISRRISNQENLLDGMRLFDYFCIVGLPNNPVVEEIASDPVYSLYKPEIISRYPEKNYDSVPLPPHLWMFCFPGGISLYPRTKETEEKAPEFFFFTLTEIDGARFYGSCLTYYEPVEASCVQNIFGDRPITTPNILAPKCICILSHYSYFRVFKDCLKEIYNTLHNESNPYPVEYLLRAANEIILPPSNANLSFTFGTKKMEIVTDVSNQSKLQDINFIAFFHYFGVEKIIELFACMLYEHKICIYSTNFTHLTITCEILVSLLEPFKWAHVFIPILPRWLLDFLQAPTPFIMGIHASYLIDCPVDTEIVYMDLDNRKIHVPPTCYTKLPPGLTNELANTLKKLLEKSNTPDSGILTFELEANNSGKYYELEIRTAFQNYFADLFLDYSKYILYLRRFPEPLKVFNKASFLRDLNSEEIFHFTKKFTDTQSFCVFLDEVDSRPRYIFDDLIEMKKLYPNDKSNNLEKQVIQNRRSLRRKFIVVPQSPCDYNQTFSYPNKTIREFDPSLVYPKEKFNLPSLLSLRLKIAKMTTDDHQKKRGSSHGDQSSFEKFFQEFDSKEEIKTAIEDDILSTYLSHNQNFRNRLSKTVDFKVIQFMTNIIKQLLNSNPIGGKDLSLIMEFFRIDNGRVLFAKLLLQNYETSKSLNVLNCDTISKPSYDLLCNLILEILTEANANSEFISASILMNVSCIYYYTDQITMLPHYLHENTRKHKIWSNNQFWESTFYNMIQSHRIKFYKSLQTDPLFASMVATCNPDSPFFITSLNWDRMNEQQKEFCIKSEENLIFKVLTYFANHMLLFGKSSRTVRRFINRITASANLSFEKIDTLEILIDNLEQFIRTTLDIVPDDIDLFDYTPAAMSKSLSSNQGNIKELYQRLMEVKRVTIRGNRRENLSVMKGYFSSQKTPVSEPLVNLGRLPVSVEFDQTEDYTVSILKGNTSGIECMEIDGTIAVTGASNGMIMIWDVRNNICYRQIVGHNNRVSCINFNEDNLASGSADQSIKLWDTQSGVCKNQILSHRGSITQLKLISNILISSSFDNTVKFSDIRCPSNAISLDEHKGPVITFQFDGNTLITGSRDTTLKIWDIRLLKSIYTYTDHKDWIRSVNFDFAKLPNTFLSASCDMMIKMWNMTTNTCQQTFYGHMASVNSFDFNSTHMISGSSDLTVKYWQLDNGKCLQSFNAHTDEITKVKFLPNNKIASASYDNTVRIFDLNSPKQSILRGHSEWISNFEVNNSRIITASMDNTLRVWQKKSANTVTKTVSWRKKNEFKRLLKAGFHSSQ